MEWTTETPTRPGWYWMRGWEYNHQNHTRWLATHVVEIREDNGRLRATLSKVGSFGAIIQDVGPDNGHHYEWAGPIEEPAGGLNRPKLQKHDGPMGKFPKTPGE